MVTVYAIHGTDADKLAQVKADMIRLGAPKIDVVDCGDYYMALEGSHRLAAAADLGLTPQFVVYGQDDVISIDGYDWYAESTGFAATEYPAGEVAGELFSARQAVAYTF